MPYALYLACDFYHKDEAMATRLNVINMPGLHVTGDVIDKIDSGGDIAAIIKHARLRAPMFSDLMKKWPGWIVDLGASTVLLNDLTML
ncbi:hypothetical protein HYALB_00013899 [Hymenoscyphus albidus]|uniref:Uncharacterized protein n=1 Tax=Hymenoscyphus albidus TaxID=595503 RepID=A0A9N9QC31_9HELO|nr:hypothetical protein HYALB_00012781 [Hymenoscyphus albidus]CAG8981183.1 hypothetical protein HYALB_00013194 [Hymenoscyphus albidus]CAG8982082.1 hypothetical protein HYALB_00013899 [Hymenoscyphus albidus]